MKGAHVKLRLTWSAVVWSLLAALAISLVCVGLVGWHQGYRLYAVRTGSMTPTYPTGSLLLDAPAQSRACRAWGRSSPSAPSTGS